MSNYRRKILSVLAVLVWMAMIWGFSSEGGTASMNTSGRIAGPLAQFIAGHMASDASGELMRGILLAAQFITRKTAHIAEFAVMGLLLVYALRTWNIRRWISAAFALGMLYAAADEIHQLSVGTRTPRWQDLCWDGAGLLFGIAGAFLTICVIEHFRNNRNNQ